MGADFILSQVTEIILTLEENELQVDVRDELPGIIATSLKIKI